MELNSLSLRNFKILEKIMQFKNTEDYITTEDLEMAVNAAINLEKPLSP